MALLRLTDLRPDDNIRELLESTIANAEQAFSPAEYEGFYPLTGFGIAELAPYHINAGGAGWMNSDFWGVSIAATNTWGDWINITMTDMAYVINTGVFNRAATPITTHIRPHPGGEDMPVVNLEQMYCLDIARAFYEKPYGVKPSNTYIVRAFADNAGTERLGLLGYALARRAYLILER